MTKRTRNRQGTQGEPPGGEGLERLIAPLVGGVTAPRESLLGWVHACGVAALDVVFREEAEAVAGPKGQHRAGRTHHHCASCWMGAGREPRSDRMGSVSRGYPLGVDSGYRGSARTPSGAESLGRVHTAALSAAERREAARRAALCWAKWKGGMTGRVLILRKATTSHYRLVFVPGGPDRHLIEGERALRDFLLTELGIPPGVTETAIIELGKSGRYTIEDILVTDKINTFWPRDITPKPTSPEPSEPAKRKPRRARRTADTRQTPTNTEGEAEGPFGPMRG